MSGKLPGKPVVVHLNLNVIDRLLGRSDARIRRRAEARRGGGRRADRLHRTGRDRHRSRRRIRAVACDYKRGPSYLFTDDDGAAFEDACARCQPDPRARRMRSAISEPHARRHVAGPRRYRADGAILSPRLLTSRCWSSLSRPRSAWRASSSVRTDYFHRRAARIPVPPPRIDR